MKKATYMVACAMVCFSTSQLVQADEVPLKNVTFLISYLDDSDPFYKDIFAGIAEMEKEGGLGHLEVVNYGGDKTRLRNEFDRVFAKSDAIIMDAVPGVYPHYYAQQAAEKNMPLIFAFVKPSPQLLDKYPNVFYISQDEFQSGVSQGLLVSQYAEKHPDVDKNSDGLLSIVNIAGVGTDTKSERERFNWQLHTIDNYPGSQFKADEIDRYPALYNYQKAYDYIINSSKNNKLNNAEVIIAQSDNMARAAADALEKTQYSIPIFSRGISPEGKSYIQSGKIKGTVKSSPYLVGYYAVKMAYNYANKRDPNSGIPYQIYKSKIELPYEIVTVDNL